jgi:hypothetical protein
VKLLDAAEVKPGTGDWTRGWDTEQRGCGGLSIFLSECDPEVTADVVGDAENLDADENCGYRVIPFGFVATMVRNTRAARDDDEQWLANTLRDNAEIPVSRGLLVRQGIADTWIGNPDVDEVPAPAPGDNDALATAITDARRLFFGKTFGLQPILHTNPTSAIRLRKAGVIELDPANGEDRTPWGDPVVISAGYYDIPGLSPVPPAFFTGPIEITLSDVNAEDIVRSVRRNKVMYQTTMMAAIDTAPCAMVRIGAAPGPVAP